MQTQRIVLGLAIAIAGTGEIASASAEEYRGTWEQQIACTPDVWRFCGDQIPDVGRIVTCLRQNTPQLSGGCRAVFESNAEQQQASRAPLQRTPQRMPRGRAPQQVQPQAVPPPGPYFDPSRPYFEEDD